MSGLIQEQDINVAAVEGTKQGGGGVPSGDELVHFTEASVSPDQDALVEARTTLVRAVGVDAMIDAAAVASLFQMTNRVANATGTPLDDKLVELTADVRAELDMNYLSAPKDLQG